MGSGHRVGVYICHCGTNIAASVDVAEVVQFAALLPGVILARDNLYMCSDPGQALIQRDISKHELDRIRAEVNALRLENGDLRAENTTLHKQIDSRI